MRNSAMTRYERLAAPDEQFGVLIEPPPADIHALLRGAPAPDAALLDSTLAEARDSLRRRLRLAGPVIASGHQVEFFHAGVLAKSIAGARLARAHAASFVYLWVDSDLPKSAYLNVTVRRGEVMHRESVAIPRCDPQRPMESQPSAARAEWAAFFQQVERVLEHEPADTLECLATAFMGVGGSDVSMRDAWPRAHAAVLGSLEVAPPRDVWMSDLSGTPEFRCFVAHLALDARRFAADYNAAQAAYRRRHRVRNEQRPAPLLRVEHDVVELPFWVYRADEARRRLFVRRAGDRLLLLADQAPIGEFGAGDFARAAAHQSSWPLETAGWRVRPRALALSAFMRLVLADLFIHGIGGAKYDEMMEEFSQRFFGVAPAPACCVTATVRRYDVKPIEAANALRHARRVLRDAWENPQRHFAGLPPGLLSRRAALLERGAELAQRRRERRAAGRMDDPEEILERTERRRVYLDLIAAREALASAARDGIARLETQVAAARLALSAARAAGDRECFFGLLPLATLRKLAERIGDALATA